MKVLAWNIQHGGGKRVPRIAAAIAAHAPDIIVLCEFRAAPGVELRGLLRDAGYPYVIAPELAARQNGVAIASRWTVTQPAAAPPAAVPANRWVEADIPEADVTVAAFYGPLENDAYDEWWHSVRAAVALRVDRPFLLAGDFNTGMSVVDARRDPFYCSEHFLALQQLGMTDTWRATNVEAREYSWYSRRAGKDLNGFRLDHALASPALSCRLANARYSHAERVPGVSDHSPLLVEFERALL
jgi:exodeoxyribonuclease III